LTVDEAVVVEDTSTAAEEKVKRGRKVGTSVAALNASGLALKQAKTKVATLYLEKKRNAASKQEKVPAGWLTNAIDIVEQEFGVPQGSINPLTIISRVRRNNVTFCSAETFAVA
jgi:hypothetical protein